MHRRTGAFIPIGAALIAAALVAGPGCATHAGSPTAGTLPATPPRDWNRFPVIVELEPVPRILALSDVHGAYDRMVALLLRHGVIASAPATPQAARWAAGDTVFVLVGDMINRGPASLEVIDFMRALEASATASGGRVIVTMGNHEAEFLGDPRNKHSKKPDGIVTEAKARGVDYLAIARGEDPPGRGRWLRERPLAARIGRWFFAHAGDTRGRGVAEIERHYRAAIDARGFVATELTEPDSLLDSRTWYDAQPPLGPGYVRALGVRHIVFGHQPMGVGPPGKIAVVQDGALLRIDCGMSPAVNASAGALLRVRIDGDSDVAESLDADGAVRELWRGPVGAP